MKLAKLPNGDPEIFYTLQGEGPFTGRPSVFIRSSLCNLHCSWCDTPFTWNWDGTPWEHEKNQKFKKQEALIDLPITEIAALISRFPCRHLVLTGGEPLLHQPEWVELLTSLNHKIKPYSVEIETNGTVIPSPEFDLLVSHYNVSPKLANSGNEASLRLKKKALQFFANSAKAVFKFVLTSPADLDEIKELSKTYGIPPERLFLMPEGTTPQKVSDNQSWVVEACLQHGYRFSDRLHIHLWGEKRGV